VLEYQVTALTFGMGLQSGATRTRRINEHLREVAAQGWRLVAVDRNSLEIPLTWRFFWERPRPADAAQHYPEHTP
jgi:hypothetical protein